MTLSSPKTAATRARAATPILSRRAGSRRSATTASASATSSSFGTSRPVTPSSTASGEPPTEVATTGRPKCMASTITRLSGSGHTETDRGDRRSDTVECFEKDRRPLAERKLTRVQHERAVANPELPPDSYCLIRRRNRSGRRQRVDGAPAIPRHDTLRIDREDAVAHPDDAVHTRECPTAEPVSDPGQPQREPKADASRVAGAAFVVLKEVGRTLGHVLECRAVERLPRFEQRAEAEGTYQAEVPDRRNDRPPQPARGQPRGHKRGLALHVDHVDALGLSHAHDPVGEIGRPQRVPIQKRRRRRLPRRQLTRKRHSADSDPVRAVSRRSSVVWCHDRNLMTCPCQRSRPSGRRPFGSPRSKWRVVLAGEEYPHER